MRINHNIAALNTYNQLTSNNSKKSSSLEKLSSGIRINRAGGDDSADTFAADIASKINAVAGGNYNVTTGFTDDDKLRISTASAGAGARVEIVGGNAVTHLGDIDNFVEEHGMNANKTMNINYTDGL